MVTRRRLLDAAATLAAIALCCAPFVPTGQASVDDSPVTVDQTVADNALISQPLAGTFAPHAGRSTGGVDWDVYAAGSRGFKLVVSAQSSPALYDAARTAGVADLPAALQPWSATGSKDRFGFSARGDQVIAAFGNGTRWRGFQGSEGIEVARRTNASPLTRTSILLSSQTGAAPAGAKVGIVATAVSNL